MQFTLLRNIPHFLTNTDSKHRIQTLISQLLFLSKVSQKEPHFDLHTKNA